MAGCLGHTQQRSSGCGCVRVPRRGNRHPLWRQSADQDAARPVVARPAAQVVVLPVWAAARAAEWGAARLVEPARRPPVRGVKWRIAALSQQPSGAVARLAQALAAARAGSGRPVSGPVRAAARVVRESGRGRDRQARNGSGGGGLGCCYGLRFRFSSRFGLSLSGRLDRSGGLGVVFQLAGLDRLEPVGQS